MEIASSVNDIPIRLTSERWLHIVENHDDLAGKFFRVLEVINDPDFIVKGSRKEKLALKKLNKKWLVVVYKEVSKKDGFVITAFHTYKIKPILKRGIIWPKQS